MTSEMRLLLARHGHATSGPDHRWTADDPLTELGHVQAQELGQHVAGLAARPDRIVSSTALRSSTRRGPARRRSTCRSRRTRG